MSTDKNNKYTGGDPVRRLLQADLAFIVLRDRLEEIALIIEAVDRRCAIADGPVAQTKDEITPAELRKIYTLAAKNRRREPVRVRP